MKLPNNLFPDDMITEEAFKALCTRIDNIEKQLEELTALATDQLLEQRYRRLLAYGEFQD